jgi:hypothetical protein
VDRQTPVIACFATKKNCDETIKKALLVTNKKFFFPLLIFTYIGRIEQPGCGNNFDKTMMTEFKVG